MTLDDMATSVRRVGSVPSLKLGWQMREPLTAFTNANWSSKQTAKIYKLFINNVNNKIKHILSKTLSLFVLLLFTFNVIK